LLDRLRESPLEMVPNGFPNQQKPLINPMRANGGSNGFESQNAAGNTLKLKIVIPSRELNISHLSTWGKGKSSSKVPC